MARLWAGTGSVVFGSGSVLITQQLTEQGAKSMRTPFALIRIEDASSDPEHGEEPDLIRQKLTVTIVTAIPGDALGENPLMGGNRTSQTTSEGRGILEIEQELFAAVKLLNTDTGVIIQLSAVGAARPLPLAQPLIYVAGRDYTFEIYATATRYYHDVRNVAATGGAGQIAVTWSAAPTRWDLLKYRLRYILGTTAPTISTGTEFTLASNLAVSGTITGLAAGTYSIAVFASYKDLTEGSTADNSSDGIAKTSLTVT